MAYNFADLLAAEYECTLREKFVVCDRCKGLSLSVHPAKCIETDKQTIERVHITGGYLDKALPCIQHVYQQWALGVSSLPVFVLLSLLGLCSALSNGHKVAIHDRGREQHLQ